MSIADVYSVIGTQLMPEFIMKSDCNITKPTTLFLYGATKCGEEYANNKDYNNALPIITNLFYSKLNYEIGTA
jgi:hypothetical protein